MTRYSDDIRIVALKKMQEASLSQTAREMNISKQTLCHWKRAAAEANQQPEVVVEDDKMTHKDESEALPTTQGKNSLSWTNEKMHAELEAMRRLNETADATIDYLIEENRQLRQRCERYLSALSLLVQ